MIWEGSPEDIDDWLDKVLKTGKQQAVVQFDIDEEDIE